jgi:hypothetical protein
MYKGQLSAIQNSPKQRQLNRKYEKQDEQGKATFKERNPHTYQRQGAQADPIQKQDSAQGKVRTG